MVFAPVLLLVVYRTGMSQAATDRLRIGKGRRCLRNRKLLAQLLCGFGIVDE